MQRKVVENGSPTVGGAEESGGRYVTVRARTIETEATERQTNAKERERREKSTDRRWELSRAVGDPAVGRRGRGQQEAVGKEKGNGGGHEEPYGGGDGWREGPLVVQHAGSVSGRETSLRRSRLALSSSSAALTRRTRWKTRRFFYAPAKIVGEKKEEKIERKFAASTVESGGRSRRSLDERTGAAPASFASVQDGKPVASRFRRSVRFLASPCSLSSPDVFPSGGRIPSRPFPFLRSDISPSATTEDRSPTRRWWTATGGRLLLFITVNEKSAERKRRKERGKSTRKVEEREEKLACVLVPSSLIEHAPSCRSAKRYGRE